jgi:hypothetical protein
LEPLKIERCFIIQKSKKLQEKSHLQSIMTLFSLLYHTCCKNGFSLEFLTGLVCEATKGQFSKKVALNLQSSLSFNNVIICISTSVSKDHESSFKIVSNKKKSNFGQKIKFWSKNRILAINLDSGDSCQTANLLLATVLVPRINSLRLLPKNSHS